MIATMNKQQQIAQVQSILKKKFNASAPADPPRTVLEEVIYAILREGIAPDQADEAYRKIRETFFDWNEVRVSTIQEVADILFNLPDPGTRAKRMIDFLQEHFERTYSFVLDDLEKKGLKQASKQLSRYKDHGVTDFVVAWVTQRSLQGHTLPLDEPSLRVLKRLGILDEDQEDLESAHGTVEHLVPKSTGHDFTDRLIQLATTYCTEESPNCAKCPLKPECPTGQTAGSSKAKPKPKSR